ncbi:MAG: hypothetical protein AB7K24_15985 [Gemmataceae bacterium]
MFAQRWPGALRPVSFPDPPPELPVDAARLLRQFGLPLGVTIYCYNDIHLHFSGSLTPLAAIWGRDLEQSYLIGDMPADWRRFWHLADQEYLQGGGWLSIEEGTGRLVVIDLDQREPVYLLSSSVANFYTILAYFLDWNERQAGGRADLMMLRDTLLVQNCIPVEELEPFWLNFIDATLDGDDVNFSVVLIQET